MSNPEVFEKMVRIHAGQPGNPKESEDPPGRCTVTAQKNAVSVVKFPRSIWYRTAKATIYGKRTAHPFYRVTGYVHGKRQMSSHLTYSAALAQAKKLAKDMFRGNVGAALNPRQAADALAALDRLEAYRQTTGRRVSILGAVSQFVSASTKLQKHSIEAAVDGFLTTVANVKRVDLAEAMAEFIKLREAKTVAPENGKRPRLSADWHLLLKGWLNEFAATFPGSEVSDLTKDMLALYMGKHVKAAPKTRNARRGAVKLFLRWCVERDYLAQSHRLFEAEDLKHEPDDPEDIDFYRPRELAALLEAADAELRPFIALAGLAGLRLKELCRLTWEDVFRVPGHVEVGALKAKTRSRRLIPTNRSLSRWLAPYRHCKGLVWPLSYDQIHWRLNQTREKLANLEKEPIKVPFRRNGFRHAFISYHFALYSNEGLTAAQAGNSPAMVHRHYKGLATVTEAKKWFAIAPDPVPNVIHLASGDR